MDLTPSRRAIACVATTAASMLLVSGSSLDEAGTSDEVTSHDDQQQPTPPADATPQPPSGSGVCPSSPDRIQRMLDTGEPLPWGLRQPMGEFD